MKHPLGSLICAIMMVAGQPAFSKGQDVPAGYHVLQVNHHRFTLPNGFTIEQAAGPPLVDRPITISFDEQGRLYASDSSGSNDKVDKQLEERPHRIVRLEDANGDGAFDRSVLFADRMMFPEGTLWHDGSLYVAAPPSIWKLTDANGDGRADERVEWFKGKTLTGCANDLHGPYLGPDGWIYWCKGAFARQTYMLPNGKPFSTRASHIFRCRTDGSGIEPVMTGGMDNPVDVVFTAEGERLFTTTFLQHPAGGKRDGLIHAVYGGVYGKDHEPVREHAWTAPELMPVLCHLGAAAPAGLHLYRSPSLGSDYQGNLFAALFNMRKVTRHRLSPRGSTFAIQVEDFVASDNLDFHPTDVLEDADGSLLIVDTGGWYKLCCPTSQLVKPDVLGAIYRVRKSNSAKVDDPRGLAIDWDATSTDELVELLPDERPAVSDRAISTLAKRGPAAIAALSARSKTARESHRRTIIWALTRIDDPQARAAVRLLLDDRSDSVKQAALHSVSVWRDHRAKESVESSMAAANLAVRRAAAEALGRIGDGDSVVKLAKALESPCDRGLEHSLTYAMAEINNAAATSFGLASTNPAVQRASLAALDAMALESPANRPFREAVFTALDSHDRALVDTAWWIAGRHPEWSTELAVALGKRLAKPAKTDSERQTLISRLAEGAAATDVQTLLARTVADASAPVEDRLLALAAMGQARVNAAPDSWFEAIALALPTEIGGEALRAARSIPKGKQHPDSLIRSLRSLAADASKKPEQRLAAFALLPGEQSVDDGLFQLVISAIEVESSVEMRSLAADILARARLSEPQIRRTAAATVAVGPLELERLLDAFRTSKTDEIGLLIVDGLRSNRSRNSVAREIVLGKLKHFGPQVQSALNAFLSELDASRKGDLARLEALLPRLATGDVRRGQAVFNSPKALCSTCHAIGYLGGTIGPDLTRIGSIRTERDLLEAILFPSQSLVRSYEPVAVVTKDGRSTNGILKSDQPDSVTLVIDSTRTVRIARADIEEISPSAVSIMPAGLDQQLTAEELADVVAFLRACK